MKIGMGKAGLKPSLLGAASVAAMLAMGGAQAWAQDGYDIVRIVNAPDGFDFYTNAFAGLEAEALPGEDLRWGLVRLDDTYPSGHAITINGGLFGTGTEWMGNNFYVSGTGDGFAAIDYTIDTYGPSYREEVNKIVWFTGLVDTANGEPVNNQRNPLYPAITEAGLTAKLMDSSTRLVVWVDQPMQYQGREVVGVIKNQGAETYTLAMTGTSGLTYETVDDPSSVFSAPVSDYVQIALDSDGAVMNGYGGAFQIVDSSGNPISNDELNALYGAALSQVTTSLTVHETASAETAIEDSSSANTRVSVRTVVSNISNRAGALARAARINAGGGDTASSLRDIPAMTGLSGGDSGEWYAGRLGVWAEGSGSFYSDDTSNDNFDGQQFSLMAGADYRYNDSVLAGAGLGYESVSIDFDSNREREVDYLSATIYGAYLINPTVSVNALGSYALGFNTVTEAAPLLADDEADHLSHRFITAANVAYNNVFDRVTTFGYAGVSYSLETFADYETSTGATVEPEDVELGQLHAFGDVGYLFEASPNATFEPFVSGRLEYDFLRDGDNDRFGAVVGGGVRALVEQNVSLEAYGNTEVARSDETATTFGLNVRVQF